MSVLAKAGIGVHRVPRSQVMRIFERLTTPLLILVCVVLVIPLPLSFPSTKIPVIGWIALALAYSAARYALRNHFGRFAQSKFLLHSYAGVAWFLLLQLIVLFMGYGSNGSDPNALWILYILPLILVSRHGTSQQWWRILGSASGTLLGFRIYTILGGSGVLTANEGDLLRLVWLSHPQLISAGVQVLVLSLLGGSVHILVRQLRESEGLLRTSQQMIGHLASQPSFKAAYQEAAKAIQELHYPYVRYAFILFWDEETQRLKVAAGVGKPEDVWRGLELTRGKGITGKALERGEPINARNVKAPPWAEDYFLAKGFEDVRSELAVPIRFQGNIIGVLDVESPRANEFDERDQVVLEGWAESLAVSFGHFLSVDKGVANAHRLAMDTIAAGSEHTKMSGWFAQVAASACEYLGANSLTLIRLAPGTGYPLLPPIAWPNRFRRRLFRGPKQVPADSQLWCLLRDWELKYWSEEDRWKEWNTRGDKWLLEEFDRNGVRTLVFVPVGSIEDPLAALFVTYPNLESIGDIQKLALTTFAVALEKSYQAIAPAPVVPRRTGYAVHQVLVPSTQRVFAELTRVREAVDNRESLLMRLDGVEQKVRELRDSVKRVTFSDRYDLSKMRFEDALTQIASEFEKLRPGDLEICLEGVCSLEDEPLYVRQVLYWVTVEAISNAVEHGRANVVKVIIKRSPGMLVVEIIDDGIGLPSKAQLTGSPYGIFYFKGILEDEMGAKFDLRGNRPKGTHVIINLPCRPDDSREHKEIMK